jgi:hypothetical protein
MSDTRKTRDTGAREGRAAREGFGLAEEMTQQATEQQTTEQQTMEQQTTGQQTTGHPAAEELTGVGEAVAETVVRTADAAVEMGQRVAEQSREVMLLGVRAAAGMNGRIVDAGYGRSHHVLGAAARALDIFREAGDSSAENVQALFSAYMTLGRGAQQMQHACLEMLDRAVERAAHKPQDLLQCKTLEEFAEVQRDLYLGAVNHALESSTTLLQLAAKTAQEAMSPLHARTGNGTAGRG